MLIETRWHKQERTVFCFPRNMGWEPRLVVDEAVYAPLASSIGRPCTTACGAAHMHGAAQEDAGLYVRSSARQESFLECVEQNLTQINKSGDSHNSIDRVKGDLARRLDYGRQNGSLP